MEKKGASALTLRIRKNICPTSKRAQVTIFIIIAIVIVALGVLIYMFYPQISSSLGGGIKNPQGFIQDCVEKDLEDAVELVSLQGGSVEPEHYFPYMDNNLEYLCYASQHSTLCVIQQPLLKQHIEKEITDKIQPIVGNCFISLRENYESKGYGVDMEAVSTRVELLPKRVVANFDTEVTLTKGDTETHDSFDVVLNNNLYELVAIANSIVESEARWGDADPLIYKELYSYLDVEKPVLGATDGTTIYIIKDKNTGDKFQFASRSLYSYLYQ